MQAGATLNLLRNGNIVNVVRNTPGGTVAIADPTPLRRRQYVYTAVQVDDAGSVSPASAGAVAVGGDGQGGLQRRRQGRPRGLPPRQRRRGRLVRVGGHRAAGLAAVRLGHSRRAVPGGPRRRRQDRPDPLPAEHATNGSSSSRRRDSLTFTFGGSGDIPVVADFDAVGHSELGVYRPSTGQWFVAGHATAFAQFGGPDDIPLALRNYNGTGADVITVYRPGTGQWFIAGQGSPIGFGGPGDVPIPLFNFNGDGKRRPCRVPSEHEPVVRRRAGGPDQLRRSRRHADCRRISTASVTTSSGFTARVPATGSSAGMQQPSIVSVVLWIFPWPPRSDIERWPELRDRSSPPHR